MEFHHHPSSRLSFGNIEQVRSSRYSGDENTKTASESPRKSKEARVLSCKKCKGHGSFVPLKKHSYRCPYINCQCDSCKKAMSERVTVMLRRYKNHSSVNSLGFKPVRFSNGNIRFCVFEKGNCEDAIPFIEGEKQRSSSEPLPTLDSLPNSPTSSLDTPTTIPELSPPAHFHSFPMTNTVPAASSLDPLAPSTMPTCIPVSLENPSSLLVSNSTLPFQQLQLLQAHDLNPVVLQRLILTCPQDLINFSNAEGTTDSCMPVGVSLPNF